LEQSLQEESINTYTQVFRDH